MRDKALLVKLDMKLVSNEFILRQQRTKYKRHQGRIFGLWDKFTNNEITSMELLRSVTKLHGPVVTKPKSD